MVTVALGLITLTLGGVLGGVLMRGDGSAPPNQEPRQRQQAGAESIGPAPEKALNNPPAAEPNPGSETKTPPNSASEPDFTSDFSDEDFDL